MEYAGRDIEDEALRAAMKDTGLGTPATRAATIETLVRRTFVARQGKQLVPTAMGIALVEGLPVASLASPELTGSWEARLTRVARGQETRVAFMNDIARYIGEVVDAIRRSPTDRSPAPSRRQASPATAPTALTCPRCKQGPLLAGKRGWGCSRWRQGCSFVVWFEAAGKRLTDAQLRDLVTKGKTRKTAWTPPGGRETPGRLVLDLAAPSELGGARFEPA
jgi:DNA topoisomerase-3